MLLVLSSWLRMCPQSGDAARLYWEWWPRDGGSGMSMRRVRFPRGKMGIGAHDGVRLPGGPFSSVWKL